MKKLVLISLGLLLLVLGCNLEDENADSGQSEVNVFTGDSMQSIVGAPGWESRNITNARNSSDPQARWFFDGSAVGRMYVYASCDLNTGSTQDNYPMNKSYVYSWTYGENGFTDHGALVEESDFGWAKQGNHVWAPDCFKINDKYYLFVPMLHKDYDNVSRVGVAKSDYPDRNFSAQTSPINLFGVSGANNNYCSDPGICKDADSENYYMFYCDGDWNTPQKGKIAYAKLYVNQWGNIIFARNYGRVQINNLPTEWQNNENLYMEGPSVSYMYNGIKWQYIMMVSVKHDSNKQQVLAYATADSITGPWTYKGLLMDSIPNEEEWTNHGSIVRGVIGDYYFLYHYGNNTYKWENGEQKVADNKRQAVIKKFNFNSNGQIDEITHDGGH